MGTFDPTNFLDQTINDANSTQTIPVPEGEYTAIVDGEPVVRQWTSKDGTKTGLAVDLNWLVDDAGVKQAVGRDRIIVRQGIMLDLNDSGGIDTGKGRNANLGRLRDAVGLNEPGKPFNFRMLQGKLAKVSIKHRVADDVIYAEVKGVARL